MKFDLLEHGEDQWSILYNGVEFLLNEISFEEIDDGSEGANANIKYTIISDKKPDDQEQFDEDVAMIVNQILEEQLDEE